ncbi:hypothetical protein ACJX0J_009972, partial [Zea mays]
MTQHSNIQHTAFFFWLNSKIDLSKYASLAQESLILFVLTSRIYGWSIYNTLLYNCHNNIVSHNIRMIMDATEAAVS